MKKLIFALLLLMPCASYSAVSSGSYSVGPGQDYENFAAAIADRATTLTGDLTFYANADYCDTSVVDVTDITNSGYRTYLTVADAYKSTGTWDTNKFYMKPPVYNTSISINCSSVTIRGFQITTNDVGNGKGCLGFGPDEFSIVVEECYFKMGNTEPSCGGISALGSTDIVIKNNVFDGFNNEGINFPYPKTGNYADNNTFVNCTTGISFPNVNSRPIVRNNIFYNCTTAISATLAFAAGSDYNSCSNASLSYSVEGSGNSHDTTSCTFSFVDAANGNYQLASNDTAAKDTGLTIASVSADFLKVSRPQGTVYDRGAFERSASGGGSTPVYAYPQVILLQ